MDLTTEQKAISYHIHKLVQNYSSKIMSVEISICAAVNLYLKENVD